ncbi:MAG: hypothetical protein ACI4SK_05340 [Christensenellales bacterium]
MDITLPLLIFFLLNNGNNVSDCDDDCCDRMTLAMCLCLLCLS